MEGKVIAAVLRDSMIAMDIGGTVAEVSEKLHRLHDEIMATLSPHEEVIPEDEDLPCRGCIYGCTVDQIRLALEGLISGIRCRCWGRGANTPQAPQPPPPPPMPEEPIPGPSRVRPKLRFKTRTGSLRNILY